MFHRSLTILSASKSTTSADVDASELALAALGWVLDEAGRAERLLSLTGLTPDALREGLMTAHVQSAVLEFLANHEPDLLACAEALAVSPEHFIAAQRVLSA